MRTLHPAPRPPSPRSASRVSRATCSWWPCSWTRACSPSPGCRCCWSSSPTSSCRSGPVRGTSRGKDAGAGGKGADSHAAFSIYLTRARALSLAWLALHPLPWWRPSRFNPLFRAAAYLEERGAMLADLVLEQARPYFLLLISLRPSGPPSASRRRCIDCSTDRSPRPHSAPPEFSSSTSCAPRRAPLRLPARWRPGSRAPRTASATSSTSPRSRQG